MANYTVTHTCGHHTELRLIGKGTERQHKLRRLSEQPCRDCIRAEETQRAQIKATKQDLPALVGTPAQVEWVERIRYETLLVIERTITEEHMDEVATIPADIAFYPGETMTVRAVVERIRREDDCRWWIDNASRVHDIGVAPLYGREAFLAELLPAAAYGERLPTTDDLAKSNDVRKQFRAVLG